MNAVLGQLGIEGGLLVSQIVNFLVLMVVLRVTLYQPILNMLEQRRQRIAQSMKDAERAGAAAREAEHDKAKILEEARREAQEVRAAATRDAEKIAQDIRARAEQEAGEIRRKAQSDAEAQAESALSGANKQIADLAILATQQILNRELANRSEHERFVAEFLAQQRSAA